MAQKELTVIILNVGKSCAQKETEKNEESFIYNAKNCMLGLMQRKIFTKPKDEVAMFLMGTDESRNSLHSELGGYNHISMATESLLPNWTMLRTLNNNIQLTDKEADWLDALIVAMDFIKTTCSTKKFTSFKIVLISPFTTCVNQDNVESVISQLKLMNIDLIVISNDLEYESLEEGDSKITFSQTGHKLASQVNSERLIEKVIQEANGVLCNFKDAILHLSYFPGTKNKSAPWHSELQIGADLRVNVTSYICMTREKFKTFKTESTNSEARTEINYEYSVEGKIVDDIDFSNTIKGYLYGGMKVPYDDNLQWDYESGGKSLICVGFTEEQYVLDEYFTGTNTNIVVPHAGCNSSQNMFNALAHVMMDLNIVMIARRVYNAKAAPKMVVLAPLIHPETKTSYFSMIELIFGENKVEFYFPNLTTNKTKPTEEEIEAIDQLIDAMDLMAATEDEPPQEAFAAQKTLNPSTQFMYRAIAAKAMNPRQPLPKFSEDLAEMFEVPKKVQEKSENPLQKIKDIFKLEEKVDDKKKKWLNKQRQAPVNSNGDNQSDIPASDPDPQDRRHISEIGTVTPMEDFDLLFRKGEKFSVLCSQMQNVVSDLVFKSTIGSFQDEKIAKALMFYREQAKIIGAHYYNDWIVNFKNSLLNRNKVEFWEKVIMKENLGLIMAEESETSAVTLEEAQQFFKVSSGKKTVPDPTPQMEDDDLFDEM